MTVCNKIDWHFLRAGSHASQFTHTQNLIGWSNDFYLCSPHTFHRKSWFIMRIYSSVFNQSPWANDWGPVFAPSGGLGVCSLRGIVSLCKQFFFLVFPLEGGERKTNTQMPLLPPSPETSLGSLFGLTGKVQLGHCCQQALRWAVLVRVGFALVPPRGCSGIMAHVSRGLRDAARSLLQHGVGGSVAARRGLRWIELPGVHMSPPSLVTGRRSRSPRPPYRERDECGGTRWKQPPAGLPGDGN